MYNLLNKLLKEDISIILLSVFIIILPLIINVNVSDMVLSIRYLALSILIFLLYLIKINIRINKEVFKNPIIISLFMLFFVNLFSASYNNLTADALFSLFRLFILLAFIVFLANLLRKSDYLIIAKSVLIFCLISLVIYFIQLLHYLFFFFYKPHFRYNR